MGIHIFIYRLLQKALYKYGIGDKRPELEKNVELSPLFSVFLFTLIEHKPLKSDNLPETAQNSSYLV